MDLCNINEIKALLARHGFHFSKAKGQNFLTQNWVPREIVARAGIDETCAALEVGPGIGPLTQELCRSAKKVIAIEVDRSLQPVLAETMAGNENLEIIFGDVLKTDIRALVAEEFAGLRPVACANLPYYITTPILAALLESRAFESITVMVQKEVAQRIAAPAGKGDYGAFSVFCQYYAVPELLFDVPPSCFIPQPKVTSAVLKLTMRTEPVREIRDEALFPHGQGRVRPAAEDTAERPLRRLRRTFQGGAGGADRSLRLCTHRARRDAGHPVLRIPRQCNRGTERLMYFVYLIRCRGDTLYAGITTDLPRRMRQHRGELPGGATYTRSHPALALEAAWRAADRSAASKLEAQLKRRSHAEKLALIAHPEQLADYVPLDAAALAAAWASTT